MILAATDPPPLWAVLLMAFIPVIAIGVNYVLNLADRRKTATELAKKVEAAEVANNKHLAHILVLVNGGLTMALREIAVLRLQLANTSPEDAAKATAAIDAMDKVDQKQITDAQAAAAAAAVEGAVVEHAAEDVVKGT